jgi:chromosome segregation ATPase
MEKYIFEMSEDGKKVSIKEPDRGKSLSAEEQVGEQLTRRARRANPIHTLPDNNVSAVFKKKRDDVKTLRTEIASLKGKIAELEEQAKLDQMYIDDCSAEIDRLNGDFETADARVTMWMSKYEEAEELRKKAEHERDLLKEMMHDIPSKKKYKVRQIAIIALALCRKALVVPKNKKKIAVLFSHMTGVSQNTISQNLCDTYKDQEIQDIAEPLKESMPELAEYLLENRFAG